MYDYNTSVLQTDRETDRQTDNIQWHNCASSAKSEGKCCQFSDG